MYDKKLFLQFFADGGDGGSSASGGDAGDAAAQGADGGKVELPNGIPEKGRKFYELAMQRKRAKSTAAQAEDKSETQPPESEEESAAEQKPPEKKSFKDLIKDEYAEEHKEYMENALKERFRKYEGLEKKLQAQDEILSAVSAKYDLDPASQSFLSDLKAKVDADDAYVEGYAAAHDMPNDQARKLLDSQRKAKALEIAQENQRKAAEAESIRNSLYAAAEKTKARFPTFDLDTEIQNPMFKRICAATGGDTTAAYYAVHHGEIENGIVQDAKRQAASALASNRNRPVENGVSASPATQVSQKRFKDMSLDELREYGRKMRNGRS